MMTSELNDGWTMAANKKNKIHNKEEVTSHVASSKPTSSTFSIPKKVVKKQTTPNDREVATKLVEEVANMFDLFLNNSTSTVVSSYQYDGRQIKLYGLQESDGHAELDKVEVKWHHHYGQEYVIRFRTPRSVKAAKQHPIYSLVGFEFTVLNAVTGEVAFVERGDQYYAGKYFKSNLRDWMKKVEPILQNAQQVYDWIVEGLKDQSSEEQPHDIQKTICPSATPEDLLGRLQWYIDKYSGAPDKQVMVNVIGTSIDEYLSSSSFRHNERYDTVSSTLRKNDTNDYTIIRKCKKPTWAWLHKEYTDVKDAQVELHQRFYNIMENGDALYEQVEVVNGVPNNFNPPAKPMPHNIHVILSRQGCLKNLAKMEWSGSSCWY